MRLQRPSLLPLLLCGLGVLLLFAFPLLSGRSSGIADSAENSPLSRLVSTAGSDEPVSPLGEDHWMDADLARSVITQWLADSPGAPTITLARRDLVWVRSLTESAARQAKADHMPKRVAKHSRKN